MSGDTIAAVATAAGPAGVAVVRVSGPGAFGVALRLTGRPAEPGRVSFRALRGPDGAVIDRCVVVAFASPRSYTGEDVVEFQCHGGSVTPRRVLEAAFAAGARLARRGEFTERALLCGRIDYDQAESVLALVNAKTDRAADFALEGLAGRAGRAGRRLYDLAVTLSSRLEHALDVAEGELPTGFAAEARAEMEALARELDGAIAKAREGRILRDGALVVLAGPPNSGKSSLMNALLGESRAIVSATPGTTRDSIEEWLDLRGWPVRLADTAGLRATADEIEAEGVRRAERLISGADVVLRVEDASAPAQPAALGVDPREIRVVTKCDLLPEGAPAPDGAVRTSALTGAGVDALRDAIAARLESLSAAGGDTAEDVGERGLSAFARARGEIRACLAAAGEDLVLLANCARGVAEGLGALVGAEYSADLLENLFSRFCVGK